MAILDPLPYSFGIPADSNQENAFEAQIKQFDALQVASNALNTGSGTILGGLLRFPQGDGHAVYMVTCVEPLTLQHVPYCDGYTIDYYSLRAITLKDALHLLLDGIVLQNAFKLYAKQLVADLEPAPSFKLRNECPVFQRWAPLVAMDLLLPVSELLSAGLQPENFPKGELGIHLFDGSLLKFKRAIFAINKERETLAVFTESCGNYEFPLNKVFVFRNNEIQYAQELL